MPTYQFKPSQELIWAVLSGAVLAIAQILVDLRPESIQDWKLWAVAGVGAVARSVGVSVLAALGKARIAPG